MYDRFDDEEPTVLEKLHENLSYAVPLALAQLHRVAQGQMVFGTDHQFRACLALARFAPFLFLAKISAVNREPRSLAHPSHSREEVLRLLDIVEGKNVAEMTNDETGMTNETQMTKSESVK